MGVEFHHGLHYVTGLPDLLVYVVRALVLVLAVMLGAASWAVARTVRQHAPLSYHVGMYAVCLIAARQAVIQIFSWGRPLTLEGAPVTIVAFTLLLWSLRERWGRPGPL